MPSTVASVAVCAVSESAAVRKSTSAAVEANFSHSGARRARSTASAPTAARIHAPQTADTARWTSGVRA